MVAAAAFVNVVVVDVALNQRRSMFNGKVAGPHSNVMHARYPPSPSPSSSSAPWSGAAISKLLLAGPGSLLELLRLSKRAGEQRTLYLHHGLVEFCVHWTTALAPNVGGAGDAAAAVGILSSLAEDAENRSDMISHPVLVVGLLRGAMVHVLNERILAELLALLQELGEVGNLMSPDLVFALVHVLTHSVSLSCRVQAMQLLEEVMQDEDNSSELFHLPGTAELLPLLRNEIVRNALVVVGGEMCSTREAALALLATLAQENNRHLLPDDWLVLYYETTRQEFDLGADLDFLVMLYSRLCEDEANCDRMFKHPGFVSLLLECAKHAETPTDSKGFLLRTLVKLVLSQKKEMIHSMCFDEVFGWFLEMGQAGDTPDIRLNACTVLKISHCLLGDVFVARACHIPDGDAIRFWGNLPKAYALLSGRQIQRIGTRCALRRLPLDMTKLVFQMLNG